MQFRAGILAGFAFGLAISGCLILYGVFAGIWAVIRLTVVSGVALPLSATVAFVAQLKLPFREELIDGIIVMSPSAIALFAGGFIGAFLVLSQVLLLARRGVPAWRLMLVAAPWSLLGGVLGIVGWSLGPTWGQALWPIVHTFGLTAPTETFLNAVGNTTHDMALALVWDGGMGFVIGLMLAIYRPASGKGIALAHKG